MGAPTMSTRREAYLPPMAKLQPVANALLRSRHQRLLFWLGLGIVCYTSLLFLALSTALIQVLGTVLEVLGLVFFGAIMPGDLPSAHRHKVLLIYFVSAIGSVNLARVRSIECQDKSTLEWGLRTGLTSLFGAVFLAQAAHCLLDGRHHWMVLRSLIAFVNTCRLFVVLALRWAVEPQPTSYPPTHSSLEVALLQSFLWVCIAVVYTPCRRAYIANITGMYKVSMRLDQVKQAILDTDEALLDEYVQRCPTHGSSLTMQDVRHVATRLLLLQKGDNNAMQSWPPGAALRFAACLFILFVQENLVESRQLILGTPVEDIFAIIRSILLSENLRITPEMLICAVEDADRTGTALELVRQPDVTPNLWMCPSLAALWRSSAHGALQAVDEMAVVSDQEADQDHGSDSFHSHDSAIVDVAQTTTLHARSRGPQTSFLPSIPTWGESREPARVF